MADQMKVIYPGTIKGGAFVAGGPFVLSKIRAATEADLDQLDFDFLASESINFAVFYKTKGLIESTSKLRDQPIYILSESYDDVYPFNL